MSALSSLPQSYFRISRILAILVIIIPMAFAEAQPVIKVDTTNFDLGNVYRDQKVNRVVRIWNMGNADLHIENVTSPCGCTTTKLKDDYVHPGDSSQVEFVLNTTTLLGKVQKYIIIVSNDLTQRNLFIHYQASIVSLLDPTPPFLYLGEIEPGKSASGVISFRNVSGRRIDILNVSSRSGILKYSTLPHAFATGDSASMTVELSLDQPIVFKDEIRIEIDSKEQRFVRVSVMGKGVQRK